MFFETIKHTADLQIVVHGKTCAELFAHAVVAMFQSIGPEAKGCAYDNNGLLVCSELSKTHEVMVQAQTTEQLLVDFLSEALFLSDVHNEAYLAVNIKDIEPTKIEAVLLGVSVESFENEIKAVTYHNLKVEQHADQWRATIVFDI